MAASSHSHKPVKMDTEITLGTPKIPLYTGKPEEVEIHVWKRSIDQHFKFMEKYQKLKIDDEDQVTLAASTLKGRAMTWWENQHRIHGDEIHKAYPNVKSLSEAMQKYFEPPMQKVRIIREKYRNARQRTTVSQYNDYFMDLRIQLEKDLPETEVIDDYLRGLNPEIAIKVEEDEPDTLEKAMAIALRKERFTKLTSQDRDRRKNKDVIAKNKDKETPTVIETKIIPKVEQPQPDLRRSERLKDKKNNRDMSKVQCFACEQFGHYAAECQNQKKNEKLNKLKESVLRRLAEKAVKQETEQKGF